MGLGKKIFVISEGEVAETEYLGVLERQIENGSITIAMFGSKSARKMRRCVEEIKRSSSKLSEVWIVIDKSSRTDF